MSTHCQTRPQTSVQEPAPNPTSSQGVCRRLAPVTSAAGRDRKTADACVAAVSRLVFGVDIHPGARVGRRLVLCASVGIVVHGFAEASDDCLLYPQVSRADRGPRRCAASRQPRARPRRRESARSGCARRRRHSGRERYCPDERTRSRNRCPGTCTGSQRESMKSAHPKRRSLRSSTSQATTLR